MFTSLSSTLASEGASGGLKVQVEGTGEYTDG